MGKEKPLPAPPTALGDENLYSFYLKRIEPLMAYTQGILRKRMRNRGINRKEYYRRMNKLMYIAMYITFSGEDLYVHEVELLVSCPLVGAVPENELKLSPKASSISDLYSFLSETDMLFSLWLSEKGFITEVKLRMWQLYNIIKDAGVLEEADYTGHPIMDKGLLHTSYMKRLPQLGQAYKHHMGRHLLFTSEKPIQKTVSEIICSYGVPGDVSCQCLVDVVVAYYYDPRIFLNEQNWCQFLAQMVHTHPKTLGSQYGSALKRMAELNNEEYQYFRRVMHVEEKTKLLLHEFIPLFSQYLHKLAAAGIRIEYK